MTRNWKKRIAMGTMAMALAVFAIGCGNDAKPAAQTTELPKKIVVGLDDNFPPMGFRDESGTIVGFDIDMAKEAAKRANIELEFKPIDWDSKEIELNSKRIDVIWNGLTITEERQKNILFSKPYLSDEQLIVVRADSPIMSKADLAGKTVGTQQASTAEYMLDNDEFTKEMKEVKRYGDYVNAFMDLELGRLDAMVVDGISSRYNMTKKPGVFRIVENSAYGRKNSGVGFRLGDTELKDKIDSLLDEMKKDGTADTIAEKWFGTADVLVK